MRVGLFSNEVRLGLLSERTLTWLVRLLFLLDLGFSGLGEVCNGVFGAFGVLEGACERDEQDGIHNAPKKPESFGVATGGLLLATERATAVLEGRCDAMMVKQTRVQRERNVQWDVRGSTVRCRDERAIKRDVQFHECVKRLIPIEVCRGKGQTRGGRVLIRGNIPLWRGARRSLLGRNGTSVSWFFSEREVYREVSGLGGGGGGVREVVGRAIQR